MEQCSWLKNKGWKLIAEAAGSLFKLTWYVRECEANVRGTLNKACHKIEQIFHGLWNVWKVDNDITVTMRDKIFWIKAEWLLNSLKAKMEQMFNRRGKCVQSAHEI